MLCTVGNLARVLTHRRYDFNANRLVTYVVYPLEAILDICGGLACIPIYRRCDFNTNRLVTYVVYFLEAYVVYLWKLSLYTYLSKLRF